MTDTKDLMPVLDMGVHQVEVAKPTNGMRN